jgi:hypothetical protein
MVVDPAPAHKPGAVPAPDWRRDRSGRYTLGVPASRSDARILILATGAVIVAGLFVAAILLLASGRAVSPTTYTPFSAGSNRALESTLKEGGPYFFPDPFGGSRNILLALEGGKVVALSDILPDTTDCHVKWKGSINSFVDCHGDRLKSSELARYRTEIGVSGSAKGLLLVDLRHLEAAPQGS